MRRSFFTNDGIMHHCPTKSKLIHILQSLAGNEERLLPPSTSTGFTVAGWTAGSSKTKQCAKHLRSFRNFCSNKLKESTDNTMNFIIVIDSYHEQSLKNITRDKRLHGTAATKYKIYDNTDMSTMNMKKKLSHIDTKDQLTEYLSAKLMEHTTTWHQTCVVAWRAEVASTLFRL